MMKKTVRFLMALMLVLSVGISVLAADVHVADEAGLLTQPQVQTLEQKAAEISDRHGCGVYIVTMADYEDYASGDVRSCAERYFTEHDLGLGNDKNGVLLLLSMAERDYALIAHGDYANAAFTDYGKEVLCDEFLDDFREDDWVGGFVDYLEGCGSMMYAADQGEPVDVELSRGGAIAVVLLVPLVVAGIVCIILVASMKSARVQSHANAYIPDGGVHLTHRTDLFVNKTVVRRKIETQSSSGGTTVNSSGFSGRSGKF